jgi:hypothetical protein
MPPGEHLTNEQLSALVDDRLAPDEQPLVRAHLADCGVCEGRLGELRLVASWLRALPVEEPPRDFRLPIGPTLVATNEPSNVIRLQRWYAISRAAAATMAAAFVFLVAGSLYVDSRSSALTSAAATQPQPLSASVANQSSASSAGGAVASSPVAARAAAAVAPAAAPSAQAALAVAATPARAQPAAAPAGLAADSTDQTAAATSAQSLPTQPPTPEPPAPTTVATTVQQVPVADIQRASAGRSDTGSPWRTAAIGAGLLAAFAVVIALVTRRRLEAATRSRP